MQINEQVLFKGYSRNPPDYQPVLTAGDLCVIEKIDGDTAVSVRKVPDIPSVTIREWVFVEELMTVTPIRPNGTPHPDVRRILKIMARKDTKAFTDLRDRVADMYVTGAHPTNMRTFFTSALNVLSTLSNAGGRFGSHLIDDSAVYTLDVKNHPLVVETRRLLSEGWRLVVSLGPNCRRPFGSLYFAREQHRITLNAEGWTRPGWPQDWPKRSARRTE